MLAVVTEMNAEQILDNQWLPRKSSFNEAAQHWLDEASTSRNYCCSLQSGGFLSLRSKEQESPTSSESSGGGGVKEQRSLTFSESSVPASREHRSSTSSGCSSNLKRGIPQKRNFARFQSHSTQRNVVT